MPRRPYVFCLPDEIALPVFTNSVLREGALTNPAQHIANTTMRGASRKLLLIHMPVHERLLLMRSLSLDPADVLLI